MKAIICDRYGDVRLAEVDRPEVGDDCMLVRVRAAAVNPLDWHYFTGTPYFRRLSAGLVRPRDTRLGLRHPH